MVQDAQPSSTVAFLEIIFFVDRNIVLPDKTVFQHSYCKRVFRISMRHRNYDEKGKRL